MLRENRGQVSLEFLLIFAISLIILIVFTLPLAESGIENTLDIYDSLKVKSDMSKISSAISKVFAEGQGSKSTVVVFSDENIGINIERNSLSHDLKLNDGKSKVIISSHKSNLESSTINFNKGKNVIVVEWPIGSENMRILNYLGLWKPWILEGLYNPIGKICSDVV